MNAPDGEKMNMDAVLERASPINHLSKLPVESKNQMNPVEKTAAFSVFPDHSNLLVSTEERATSSSWPQEENRDGMVKRMRSSRNCPSIYSLFFLLIYLASNILFSINFYRTLKCSMCILFRVI